LGLRRDAALTGRKSSAKTVDETLNALHNLVSPLQRNDGNVSEAATANRQSRALRFFNNQTTDKCGRLMANATVTSVAVMLKSYQCSHSKTCWLGSSEPGQSVF
jgi:hypothetical protein